MDNKLLIVVRAGVVQEIRGNMKGVKVEVFDMDDFIGGPSEQELGELREEAEKGKDEIYY
jgi:hypothetical protein